MAMSAPPPSRLAYLRAVPTQPIRLAMRFQFFMAIRAMRALGLIARARYAPRRLDCQGEFRLHVFGCPIRVIHQSSPREVQTVTSTIITIGRPTKAMA